MEREAARRGGGGLVAPVQRVGDYLQERVEPDAGKLPTSSYRCAHGSSLSQLASRTITGVEAVPGCSRSLSLRCCPRCRLGVKSSALHGLYPPFVDAALQQVRAARVCQGGACRVTPRGTCGWSGGLVGCKACGGAVCACAGAAAV